MLSASLSALGLVPFCHCLLREFLLAGYSLP
jgi:hypothetical protein